MMWTGEGLLLLLALCLLFQTSSAGIGIIPPTITSGPDGIVYIHYDKITILPCKASGVPKPTIQWLRNHKPIPSSFVSEDGSIEFIHAQSLQEGYFRCTATNPGGTAITNTTAVIYAREASFEVTDSGPNNVKYHANVGDSVKIICNSSDLGSPRPRAVIAKNSVTSPTSDFEWSDDAGFKVDFHSTGRVQLDDIGNLRIASVTAGDAATGLKCRIRNSFSDIVAAGSPSDIIVNTRATTLNTAPVIIFQSNQRHYQATYGVYGLEGRQVIMRCIFKGSPDITVEWRKDSGLAPDHSRVFTIPKKYQTIYIINNLHKSDEGTYYCKGTNSISSTDFKVQLIVEVAPVFLLVEDGPYDRNVTVGDDIIINCKPQADPPVSEIIWLMNGQQEDWDKNKYSINEEGNSLTIKNVCNDCESGVSDTKVVQCVFAMNSRARADQGLQYILRNGYINVIDYNEDIIIEGKTLLIDAENGMIVFVDGRPQFRVVNANQWGRPDKIIIPDSAHFIAVSAYQLNDTGGIIASFADGSLVTNSAWKCTNALDPDWLSRL